MSEQKKQARWMLSSGAFFMMTAVILGALGAHFLKSRLGMSQLDSFNTGVRYQLIHGLALLILYSIQLRKSADHMRIAALLIAIGIVFFSFSIYALSLRDLLGLGEGVRFLGPVTPVGGILMIAGWGIIFFKTLFTR